MSSSPGRPPVPKAERRSKRIYVCVTPAEHRTIRATCTRGQTLSDFGREAMLAACHVRAEAPPSPPADGAPHVADPPPRPAPVTSEGVKRRLRDVGLDNTSTDIAANVYPLEVARILDQAHGMSPKEIYTRIITEVV